ncbi:MAG: VanZ family protein [Clostridia bacterium]|nr:VanZ family protein [Clostridia bacterium]
MNQRSHEQILAGKTQAKRIFATVLTVGWMAVIFLFSAQTGEISGNTSGGIVDWVLRMVYPDYETFSVEKQLAMAEIWHLFIRKAAHFTEYAVLGLLTANTFQTYPIGPGYKWSIPGLVCVLYAISDEIHQYFVPDRACRFWDVCIDTAGAIMGIALFALVTRLAKRNVKRSRTMK